jgi:hypothetical protein
MKGHFLLFFLSVLVISCQKDYNKKTPRYKYIPKEANTVVKINAINDFLGSAENHKLFSNIYYKELEFTSDILRLYNTSKPVFLATIENSNDFLILTEFSDEIFNIDSIPNHISETIAEFKIDKIQIDSTTIYTKQIGNVFATSQNIELLNGLDEDNENIEISRLIETTNNTAVSSVIYKANTLKYNKLLFNTINSENYVVLDIDSYDKSIIYDGILASNDSITSIIDCFKNNIPQKVQSTNVVPADVKSLLSFTYDDYATFNQTRNKVFPKYSDSIPNFLNFTNEVSITDNALIFHSFDTNIIIESIDNKELNETFRDVDIFKFHTPDFFQTKLMPIIHFDNAQYFCVLHDFILFSETKEVLKSLVSQSLNNNTLGNQKAFIDLNEKLSDEVSLFIYKNSAGLKEMLGDDADKYNTNALQFVYEDNYAHINGVIQKYSQPRIANSVTEAYSTTLEAEIIKPPQTVKNHVTKTHDIIVQDADYNLYLISSSGNILWKKKLQDKILGEVEQIDTYKNGRLQLAFATSKRLYVLDRNGNDVGTFPLNFNDKITQPLSVFDYDKTKNYRLLVTQGKNLLMYDAKGKAVNGFNYKTNTANIITQPRHFRVASKDYIVFGAGNKMKILNRQGSTRINVNDKIRFSNNNIYLYKNKFTTTNTLGELVQADTKGKLTLKNLNLTEQHSIEATNKTLVSLMDNKLAIKSRVVDLEFGDYTSPKIFYLNDKIYVTTTDLQSKKVYLFDSQAKSIPNFPVFGTSSAELQKLDKDRGLELITQSDDKSIIIYKIN